MTSSRTGLLLLSCLAAACGGPRRLAVITAEPRPAREIHRLDAAGNAREIRPLADTATATHEIRPLARPPAAAAPPDTGEGRVILPLAGTPDPLAGTRWEGSFADGPLAFEFRAGDTLIYTLPSGTWDNGTWSQTGDEVRLEMNDGYATWTGHVRAGVMAGEARNRTGRRWSWSATRR